MSDEEKAPIRPVDEATATPFDPNLVLMNMRTAEQTESPPLPLNKSPQTNVELAKGYAQPKTTGRSARFLRSVIKSYRIRSAIAFRFSEFESTQRLPSR